MDTEMLLTTRFNVMVELKMKRFSNKSHGNCSLGDGIPKVLVKIYLGNNSALLWSNATV